MSDDATRARVIAEVASLSTDPLAVRELRAVREIAHAFLVADSPSDVYQVALDRVTPLLGAAFSLIMQLGEDGELLRPVAQHEWPSQYRAWIGALRVRVGDGPSGQAVAQRTVIEIPDLFAEPQLDSWYDVARELGFRSIIAAPLVGARGPVGAIAFYFADATRVSDEQSALVRLVADQLAATADKSVLIDELRRSNAALAEANAQMETHALAAAAEQRRSDDFVGLLTQVLEDGLRQAEAAPDPVHRASLIASSARDLVTLERGSWPRQDADTDPREALMLAIQHWRSRLPNVRIVTSEPPVVMPTLYTDGRWLTRLLELLLGRALAAIDSVDGQVNADLELSGGCVVYRLRWRGSMDVEHQWHAAAFSPFAEPLSQAFAKKLGAALHVDAFDPDDPDDADRAVTLTLPAQLVD